MRIELNNVHIRGPTTTKSGRSVIVYATAEARASASLDGSYIGDAGQNGVIAAEDLIRRGITTSQRLGIRGASNGGALMGVAVNRRPELFAAVHARNPVFDLRRLGLMAGNARVDELGDPENPEHWAFMSRFSPYHNVSSTAKYPPVLITSNRRDDRVPVGNGRKMTARLEEMGHEVFYHEAAQDMVALLEDVRERIRSRMKR